MPRLRREEKTSAFLSDNNLPALHQTRWMYRAGLDDLLTAKVTHDDSATVLSTVNRRLASLPSA